MARRDQDASWGCVALALLALAATAAAARAGDDEATCVFSQHCTASSGHCMPIYAPHKPAPMRNFTKKLACPEHAASACCNSDQNEDLVSNFILIDAVFGGECEACAQNLRRFWCEFVCGPRQVDYIHFRGYANHTGISGRNLCMEVDLAMDPDYMCGAYASCSGVSFVKETSAMSTALGFFEYQGQQGAASHGEWIYFNVTDASGAISTSVDKCDGFISQTTGNTSHCPCASCADSCSLPSRRHVQLPSLNSSPISITDGLSLPLVLLSWVVALVVASAASCYAHRNWIRAKVAAST